MLKIKDNVNLKELEKFGFTKNERNMYEYDKKGECGYILLGYYNKIYCSISEPSTSGDILYDLIQADLVEKV